MENQEQQPLQPQSSIRPAPALPVLQPLPPKKAFNTKWFILSLSLILIAIIPVTMYFLSQKSTSTTPIPILPVLPTQTVTKLIPTATPAPIGTSAAKIAWALTDKNPSPIETEIKNALPSFDLSQTNYNFNDGRKPAIINLQISSISANFAITGMEMLGKDNQLLATDGFQFYLYKNSGKWNLLTGDENNFCDVIKTFPSDLLDGNLKSYLKVFSNCFPNNNP